MNTVNVLEMTGENNVLSLRSFEETKEGNEKAEKLFAECMSENSEVCDEDIETATEDGYWEEGDYKLFLIHSV